MRLMPPHWVVGKHHDVTFPDGHIDDGSLSREVGSTGEHSANQKVFLRRKSEDDSRTHFDRRLCRCRARNGGRRSGRCRLHRFSTLRDISIGRCTASGRTTGRSGLRAAAAAAAKTRAAPNLQQWRLIKIDCQIFVLAVCDRA